MAKFLTWPLIDRLIDKYWNERDGWSQLAEWDAKDLGDLETFANSELQRRADTRSKEGVTNVRGNRTVH